MIIRKSQIFKFPLPQDIWHVFDFLRQFLLDTINLFHSERSLNLDASFRSFAFELFIISVYPKKAIKVRNYPKVSNSLKIALGCPKKGSGFLVIKKAWNSAVLREKLKPSLTLTQFSSFLTYFLRHTIIFNSNNEVDQRRCVLYTSLKITF